MSDKTKTKAELLEMLAGAQYATPPLGNTQSRKTRPASQRTVKIKNVRVSASRKQRRR
jgi:hypothetical protein